MLWNEKRGLVPRFFVVVTETQKTELSCFEDSPAPSEAPSPDDELSVRTDKLTLQFRKYWFDELREATAPQDLPILQGD